MSKYRLQRSFKKYDQQVTKAVIEYPGELGVRKGGQYLVEVPSRPGYYYVRLLNNLSELIVAFNDGKVSPVYGLPVSVARNAHDQNRWYIIGRDSGRYQNWGSTSYLPNHGDQHSFNPANPGADPVWVWQDQIMPINAVPSGSSGALSMLIEPGYYYINGERKSIGTTSTGPLTSYLPVSGSSRFITLYVDDSGDTGIISGDEFTSTISGSMDAFIPTTSATQLPVRAIRLESNTTYIPWSSTYDLRPLFAWGGSGGSVIVSGSSGGGAGDLYWFLDGALASGSSVVSSLVAARDFTISSIVLYVAAAGSSGSTIIDVKKNGATLYPTNTRPTVAYNDANHLDDRVPNTTVIHKYDVLSLDVISAAVGASGMSVCIIIASSSSGGGSGTGDMLKSEYATNGTSGTVDRAEWANHVLWSDVSGTHNHDDRYYTETQLQTSGSAQVNWGNLTNVPALAGGSTTSQALFTAEGVLVVNSGALRIYNHMGVTKTIIGVYLSVSTPPIDASILVDIHKNGTTIFTTQSNRPAITSGNDTGNSTTIQVPSWANGEYLTMDIDQIGSGTAGSNLTVHVVYN